MELTTDLQFKLDLQKVARKAIENLPRLEKSALEIHSKLTELSHIDISTKVGLWDPPIFLIGTGHDISRVHLAVQTYRNLKDQGKVAEGSEPIFIVSGGIGITKHRRHELNAKGINANVYKAMLLEYNILESNILVDNESDNTPYQTRQVRSLIDQYNQIHKEKPITEVINIQDKNHAGRFNATFFSNYPELKIYTVLSVRDFDSVGRSSYDFGMGPTQWPGFLAEAARYVKYSTPGGSNDGKGPADPDGIMEYMKFHLKNNPEALSGKRKQYLYLKEIYDKNKEEILKHAQRLANLRVKSKI